MPRSPRPLPEGEEEEEKEVGGGFGHGVAIVSPPKEERVEGGCARRDQDCHGRAAEEMKLFYSTIQRIGLSVEPGIYDKSFMSLSFALHLNEKEVGVQQG